ncbi:MAG: RIP metalloprotease RseP [Ignavibacteriales bacterium]|nr:RIP metalloprotease RseP [Ignavibacteriales bacterium]
MAVLSITFYFIVTIGILVFVHELGHFLAARIFGMRADKFYIGFDFFGWRLWKHKVGETEYGIGVFPLGGYVKIAGMIDESMDMEFTKTEPQPWEFRSKPVWQRMIVISAGVLMNMFLAIAIFWGIAFKQGRVIRPVTEIGYVLSESYAAKAGLRVGDNVVAINDRKVTHWNEIEAGVYSVHAGEDVVLNIDRAGSRINIPIGRDQVPGITDERFGIFPAGLTAVVASVDAGKPAAKIGLQPGDTLLAVNGMPVSYASLPETIRRYANQEIELTWKRQQEMKRTRVTPTSEGRIGIALSAVYTGPIVRERYGVFESFSVGIREAWEASAMNFASVAMIVRGKVEFSKSVGGPIKIAQMANQSAESGVLSFLAFMAVLSVSLALLNILPFPVLDGGHLVFLAYEAIFQREVPERIRIMLQQAGLVVLLVFMAFVLYNDLRGF